MVRLGGGRLFPLLEPLKSGPPRKHPKKHLPKKKKTGAENLGGGLGEAKGISGVPFFGAFKGKPPIGFLDFFENANG